MMVQQETACLCLLNTGDGLHCTNSDTNGNIRIVSWAEVVIVVVITIKAKLTILAYFEQIWNGIAKSIGVAISVSVSN